MVSSLSQAAAAVSPRLPARARLRPTMQSDLEFVLTLEQNPEHAALIAPWERTQHEAAIRFPDFRHFIIEGGSGLDAVGFVILIGCRSQNHSLELKRMVVRDKGEGYGRAAIKVVKKVAFDDLGAHRLWLDVKARNARAIAFYDSEGFVEEGRLREAVRVGDEYETLVVKSMLKREFEARRMRAEEMRP